MAFNDDVFSNIVNDNAKKNKMYPNNDVLANLEEAKTSTVKIGKPKNLKVYKSILDITKIVAGTVAFTAIVGGFLIPSLIKADQTEMNNMPNADYYDNLNDITKYNGMSGSVSFDTKHEADKLLNEIEHENSFTR